MQKFIFCCTAEVKHTRFCFLIFFNCYHLLFFIFHNTLASLMWAFKKLKNVSLLKSMYLYHIILLTILKAYHQNTIKILLPSQKFTNKTNATQTNTKNISSLYLIKQHNILSYSTTTTRFWSSFCYSCSRDLLLYAHLCYVCKLYLILVFIIRNFGKIIGNLKMWKKWLIRKQNKTQNNKYIFQNM